MTLSRSAIAATLTATLFAASAEATEPRIGSVVQREYNGAVAEPHGQAASHAILFRDGVFALDTIKTGAGASTELEFLDRTKIQVGAGAQVRLDNFVYDPATTVGAGHISFAIGAFRYVGGSMTTEENIRLVTPTATMVIRGTELVIYVWPDGQTEVNVVSGAVDVAACEGGGNRLAMTGMRIVVGQDCTMQVAAIRTLPSDFAALDVPEPYNDSEEGGEDGGNDGGSRSEGGGPRGGKGKAGGTKGSGNNGGGNNPD
jgi:uncharacterized membrane protein YgcG